MSSWQDEAVLSALLVLGVQEAPLGEGGGPLGLLRLGDGSLLRWPVLEAPLSEQITLMREWALSFSQDAQAYVLLYPGELLEEKIPVPALIAEAGVASQERAWMLGCPLSDPEVALREVAVIENLLGGWPEDASLILFSQESLATPWSLTEAKEAIRGAGLSCEEEAGYLLTWFEPTLKIQVRFLNDESVTREVQALIHTLPNGQVLKGCDACLMLTFDDLLAVLDETNTLIELQLSLQDATGGILYNTWNRQLLPPEIESAH